MLTIFLTSQLLCQTSFQNLRVDGGDGVSQLCLLYLCDSFVQKTDITDYALEALSKSHVRRVYLVGRRGPVQAAFTVAELRELMKLPRCRPVLNRTDFAAFEKHTDGLKLSCFLSRFFGILMNTFLVIFWRKLSNQQHSTICIITFYFSSEILKCRLAKNLICLRCGQYC